MRIKTYTVWFELFGKKMKTTVPARTKDEAENAVKSKIIFHKIRSNDKSGIDDIFCKFNDIFDIFKDKK